MRQLVALLLAFAAEEVAVEAMQQAAVLEAAEQIQTAATAAVQNWSPEVSAVAAAALGLVGHGLQILLAPQLAGKSPQTMAGDLAAHLGMPQSP